MFFSAAFYTNRVVYPPDVRNKSLKNSTTFVSCVNDKKPNRLGHRRENPEQS